MRPQLGSYGAPVVKSPYLDKLAETGLRFQYACTTVCTPPHRMLPVNVLNVLADRCAGLGADTQYSYCCPSRNSFLR